AGHRRNRWSSSNAPTRHAHRRCSGDDAHHTQRRCRHPAAPTAAQTRIARNAIGPAFTSPRLTMSSTELPGPTPYETFRTRTGTNFQDTPELGKRDANISHTELSRSVGSRIARPTRASDHRFYLCPVWCLSPAVYVL